jgi:hypothetical protein
VDVQQAIVQFIVGGAFVSAFAVLADVLKPKSFAGLFGAAPSIALATLLLTITHDGVSYAAIESRAMIAGAIAFCIYAWCVAFLLMRWNYSASFVTPLLLLIWLGIAIGMHLVGLG